MALICTALRPAVRSGVAIGVPSGSARVGDRARPRAASRGRASAPRRPRPSGSRRAWGELGEVLGDQQDDVVAALDLGQERPAVQRDDAARSPSAWNDGSPAGAIISAYSRMTAVRVEPTSSRSSAASTRSFARRQQHVLGPAGGRLRPSSRSARRSRGCRRRWRPCCPQQHVGEELGEPEQALLAWTTVS